MESKFEVIINRKSAILMTIEIRDIASRIIVLPEMEVENLPYEKFETLIKGLPFLPGEGYVREVEYTELRSWLSGFNGPKLEHCLKRAEEWIAEGKGGKGYDRGSKLKTHTKGRR